MKRVRRPRSQSSVISSHGAPPPCLIDRSMINGKRDLSDADERIRFASWDREHMVREREDDLCGLVGLASLWLQMSCRRPETTPVCHVAHHHLSLDTGPRRGSRCRDSTWSPRVCVCVQCADLLDLTRARISGPTHMSTDNRDPSIDLPIDLPLARTGVRIATSDESSGARRRHSFRAIVLARKHCCCCCFSHRRTKAHLSREHTVLPHASCHTLLARAPARWWL